ncbi:hypothetical protein ACQEV4_40280 [Streptomyces shenzhenensis]
MSAPIVVGAAALQAALITATFLARWWVGPGRTCGRHRPSGRRTP